MLCILYTHNPTNPITKLCTDESIAHIDVTPPTPFTRSR